MLFIALHDISLANYQNRLKLLKFSNNKKNTAKYRQLLE